MSYDRPATTVNQQIQILRRRGLMIQDQGQAKQILDEIGYFRFKGYCLSFYDAEYEHFISNTSIEQVYQLYQFDTDLRALLISVCQRIEIRIKATVGSMVPLRYGPVLSSNVLISEDAWLNWTRRIKQSRAQGSTRQEVYMRNYAYRYGEFPLWVDLELTSLGNLSKLYSWLTSDARKMIADQYSIPHQYLGNWLHCLTVIRNTCAHNSRLIGKPLSIPVRLPNKWRTVYGGKDIFALWFISLQLLSKLEYARCVNAIVKLVARYHMERSIRRWGFPSNWQRLLVAQV